jgi:hypothetical protein
LIHRRKILEFAAQTSLNPHVIEKDYVLGWVLAGIYAHDELAESWIFKGGTCLKKCFFETYRFSEDLDFTLWHETHLDEASLKRVFSEVGAWVYDETGIEMPADQQDFDVYRGPYRPPRRSGRASARGLPPHRSTFARQNRVLLCTSLLNTFANFLAWQNRTG